MRPLLSLFNLIADLPSAVRTAIVLVAVIEEFTLDPIIYEWAHTGSIQAILAFGYYFIWVILLLLVGVGFWRDYAGRGRPVWPSFISGGVPGE